MFVVKIEGRIKNFGGTPLFVMVIGLFPRSNHHGWLLERKANSEKSKT